MLLYVTLEIWVLESWLFWGKVQKRRKFCIFVIFEHICIFTLAANQKISKPNIAYLTISFLKSNVRDFQHPKCRRSLTLRFTDLYVFRKKIRKMPIFKGIFLSEKNFKLKISVDFLKVQSIFFPENFTIFWIISKLNAEKSS